jgi:hypothetical protein
VKKPKLHAYFLARKQVDHKVFLSNKLLPTWFLLVLVNHTTICHQRQVRKLERSAVGEGWPALKDIG